MSQNQVRRNSDPKLWCPLLSTFHTKRVLQALGKLVLDYQHDHNHIIISTYVPKNMWKLLPARRPPRRAQISWFIRSQFCRNCVLLVDGFWLDCFCNCNYKCILYIVRCWLTIKPIINSRNPFLGVQSGQMLHIELPEDSPHLILVSPHHLRFPFSDFSDFSVTIWGFLFPW